MIESHKLGLILLQGGLSSKQKQFLLMWSKKNPFMLIVFCSHALQNLIPPNCEIWALHLESLQTVLEAGRWCRPYSRAADLPVLSSITTGILRPTWCFKQLIPQTQTNTFQAVLVTNGTQSFAVFNYKEISWTSGALSRGNNLGLGGFPAQVCFLLVHLNWFICVTKWRSNQWQFWGCF